MTFESEDPTTQQCGNNENNTPQLSNDSEKNCWRLSTLTLVNLFVITLTLCSLFYYVILPQMLVEQSLACAFQPPPVNLNDMHKEIRKLLIEEEFTYDIGAILMHGGIVTYRYNTDVEEDFRQESNFWYLSGYDQPNATFLLDIFSGESYLFIPFQPIDYAIWNGKIETPDSVKAAYGFDYVYYHEDLSFILGTLSNYDPNYIVYVYDSHVEFPSKELYTVNDSQLPRALDARRALKTDSEIELMRYTAKVSSDAHRLVMNHTTYGHYEYNAEGKFLDGCFACGLTIQAYLPICASGNNSAILHYNDNNKLMQNGEFLLIDAGAEYFGYAADITRTYPVNGVFTDDQTVVYNMVLNVQTRVIMSLEVGLSWSTLQSNCNVYICEELINNGFITGTSSECISNRIYYYFFPHGVSHMLGLDVHDPRGYSSTVLQARNVITVEPGIYFNSALFEVAFKEPVIAKFLVADKIQPLLDSQFGGVRIEDIVVIHETYVETISDAPRTIFEIESLMNSGN